MRNFGSIVQVRSNAPSFASGAGGNATVTFDLPQDRELLVLGISAQGAAAARGNSQVIRSFKYRSVEHILGDVDTASAPFISGVPFGHIGAKGNVNHPRWAGDAQALRSLIRRISQGEAQAKPGCGDASLLECLAMDSLKLFSGQCEPQIAGFLVNGGEQLKLVVQDVTPGATDRSTFYTLTCLVLGESYKIGPKCRAYNAPFWYSHTLKAVSTAAATLDIGNTLSFPEEYVNKGGVVLHRETRATIYLVSDGSDVTDVEAHKIRLALNEENAGPNHNFGSEIPLSALNGQFAIFSRIVKDKTKLGWKGDQTALSAACQLNLTDYLLCLPEGAPC